MKIKRIQAREIFDSRGFPTIQCELLLDNGAYVVSSVPCGASKGMHEAVELRDGGNRLRGMGVQKAVDKIHTVIAPALEGQEPNVVQMDALMLDLDGTDDKSKLGANTILAVSIAVCKAQAIINELMLYEFIMYLCGYETVALPYPMYNLINGGIHADNNLLTQEVMIIPIGEPTFRSAMDVGLEIFHGLKTILQEQGKSTNVGDEGGFAPKIEDEYQALDLIMEAIERFTPNKEVMISLDIAASQFYDNANRMYNWYGKPVTSEKLLSWYNEIITKYPIYSIEDPFSETDWENWEKMIELFGGRIKVVGDDIFATNPQRIWNGIENDVANTSIIKPNQIGTVTETLQAVKLCDEYNWDIIVSHRSGETNDDFIADLAVGVSSPHIKAGGLSRGERMAKYNRLVKIEDDLLMDE